MSSTTPNAARVAQLQAREKETRIQLKEAKEIKAGWKQMQEELGGVKQQLNRLNSEYVNTVAICRQMKKKNAIQAARIIELERLLRELKRKEKQNPDQKQIDFHKKELEYQVKILKLVSQHTETASELKKLQLAHKDTVLHFHRLTEKHQDAAKQRAHVEDLNTALTQEVARLQEKLANCSCGDETVEAESPPAVPLPTRQNEEEKSEAMATIAALKEKLAQSLADEADLRLKLDERTKDATTNAARVHRLTSQLDQVRAENASELEKRQQLMTELHSEKVTSAAATAAKVAATRERDDEIARLKLEALDHKQTIQNLNKKLADGANTGAGGNKRSGGASPARRKAGKKTNNEEALLQEISMLKMMVDGAKKEVARRDKMIRRMKKGQSVAGTTNGPAVAARK